MDRELDRIEKAVVFTIMQLNALVDEGMIEGKPFEVTEKSKQSIEGFEPTEEEIKLAMHILASEGYIGNPSKEEEMSSDKPILTKQEASAINCPVCGYFCAGRGGRGCIDKPFLYANAKDTEE